MKNFFPSVLASVALTATAVAGTFSVSGPGGAIPDAGGVTWNTAPTATLSSTVSVNYNVTGITAVKLNGLAHTWRGDVHVYLTNPGGSRFNVIVRPGWTGTGFGDSGDFVSGNYSIVDSGGAALNQGAVNINGGTYNQFLNSGAGMWTSGTFAIANSPLSGITGSKGTWQIDVVDWAGSDLGSMTGWTLEGNDVSGFNNFCDPGTGGVIACPCGNAPSGANRGCNNFGALSGGATISASGNASVAADTLVLTATGENNTALTVFVQGDTTAPPGIIFGAGVRCVANPLLRLYTGSASGGTISRPSGADPSISARSAALGDTIPSSGTRYYFTYYRDPNAAGPCANQVSTFNASNAGSTTWGL